MLSNSKTFSFKFQGWSFGLSLITFIVLTASLIATSFWIYFIGSHYNLLSRLKLFVWTIVIWLINWSMIKSNTLVNHFSPHVWNSFKLITQMYPKYKQLIQWISLFQDNTETVKKKFFLWYWGLSPRTSDWTTFAIHFYFILRLDLRLKLYRRVLHLWAIATAYLRAVVIGMCCCDWLPLKEINKYIRIAS